MTATVHCLVPNIGFAAEIRGVDLRAALPAEDHAIVRRAMADHAVLVFRGQPITDAQHMRFAESFGPIEIPNEVRLPGQALSRTEKNVADVSNLDEKGELLKADDRRRIQRFGNMQWHTDSSFKRVIAKYSLLAGHAVPPTGGNTEFADLRAAHDAMDDELRARSAGRSALHTIVYSRSLIGFDGYTAAERASRAPVPQPLVHTIAESGRKSLYLAAHAESVVGLPVAEGRLLLWDLMAFATRPEFIYSHRWQDGDLVMWDNRCTMHRARPYEDGKYRRDVRRVTVSTAAG